MDTQGNVCCIGIFFDPRKKLGHFISFIIFSSISYNFLFMFSFLLLKCYINKSMINYINIINFFIYHNRDHRTVLVGDSRGRVFSWSVVEQPGRGLADHWQRDDGSDSCTACNVRFSMYERKHHCRNCGHLYCSR